MILPGIQHPTTFDRVPQPGDQPILEAFVRTPQPGDDRWAADKQRTRCKGRDAIVYMVRGVRPNTPSDAESFPELSEASKALRESAELASLNLVRERLAAQEDVINVQRQLVQSLLHDVEEGAGNEQASIEDLAAQHREAANELRNMEAVATTLRKSLAAHFHNARQLARTLEKQLRDNATARRSIEKAKVLDEISAALSPLLERLSAIEHRSERIANGLNIPDELAILGPPPAGAV